MLEPSLNGEKLCMWKSKGVGGEYFYFYMGIPFSIFLEKVLKALNVSPTQFLPNNWAFVRAFEILCSGLYITLTVGIFLFMKPKRLINGIVFI